MVLQISKRMQLGPCREIVAPGKGLWLQQTELTELKGGESYA
jgi:hypothetical protein